MNISRLFLYPAGMDDDGFCRLGAGSPVSQRAVQRPRGVAARHAGAGVGDRKAWRKDSVTFGLQEKTAETGKDGRWLSGWTP